MFTSNRVPQNLFKELAMAHHAQRLFASTRALAPTTDSGKDPDGTHILAGMLLAAVLAALLVVADQVISTWADGHLLAGWVALWTVAFAGLALLAPPLRQVSTMLAQKISDWRQAARLREQENQFWQHAKQDPRVMSELQAAWMREHDEALPN